MTNVNIQTLWDDCLLAMQNIGTNSVDFVFADMPYGRTRNLYSYDQLIDPKPFFLQVHRILKDNGVCAVMARQPFTTYISASNYKNFRYCWYWNKGRFTNWLNWRYVPLNGIEDICIFYKTRPSFFSGQGENEIINIPNIRKHLHPYQKPVSLVKYILSMYCKKGFTVMDPCMGSGTTGVACKSLGLGFIGIEKEEHFFQIADERINAYGTYEYNKFHESGSVMHKLFKDKMKPCKYKPPLRHGLYTYQAKKKAS